MKNARTLPQFNLRLTAELKGWLIGEAEKNCRSLTGEINAILGEVKRQRESHASPTHQASH
ncbi:Arc family DNA-binding protein [Deefgea piscis]|uniref:Arc family DNA-binding protein n=1 Tax=Deefgea piscis TaxID=2739061 RepID=UPI001C7E81E5|nr:Arc family DNA-binding protein [Deefgea piscis]